LSPEQVAGGLVDPRSDLFALGSVLYELISYAPPFAASSGDETLARIGACSFVPLRSLRPEVPEDLAALVERALARAPEDRFSDAGRMYESLLSHLYGSSERFSASDAAGFVGRMRDTPSRPPSLSVTDDQDRGTRDGQSEPLLPAESLPPPPMEAGARLDETEPAERRVVSLLVIQLTAQDPDLAERQRTRLEPIVFRYGGRVLESERFQLLAAFPSIGTKPASTEMAVRCALFALRQMATSGAESPLAGGTPRPADTDSIAAGRPAGTDSTGAASPDAASAHPSRPAAESHADDERLRQADDGAAPAAMHASSEPSAGIHTGWARVRADATLVRDDAFDALLATALQMSRLRPRGCSVSLSAARKIRGQFMFDAPGEITSSPGLIIRDLKAPSDMYGRFVGRKSELKLLGEILSLATRRRTHVISLAGPAGMGKTRLLLETRRRLLRGSYRVGFYHATCRSDGRSIPFSGLAEMLAVLSGIQNGDPPDRVIELQPRFRALGLHDEEVAALLGLLGAPENGPTGLVPLTVGFGRTVASLCSEQLQVFAWDNAQAMDDRSLDVIKGAVMRLGATRAVFIFAGREVPSRFFETHPSYHRLALGDLEEDHLRELVAQRVGARVASDELISFCREWAGGNPLHVEELLRNLLDTGAITQAEDGAPLIRLPAASEPPPTLEDLLRGRAKRLREEERQIVELAAVLGDPVPLEIIAEMSGVEWLDIEKTISLLEEQGILRRSGASTVSFLCPLLREVVLDALPRDLRSRLHETAAQAYERSLGDRALDQVDRLAIQLLEAGNTDRAAVMHARAAQRESSRGRYEAAVRSLSRALSLADFGEHEPEELADWVHELASLAYHARSAPGIADLACSVLARIDTDPRLATRVQARVDLASILVSTHEFEQADQHLDTAHVLAQGDSGLLQATVLTQAELLRRRGDFQRALVRFEELTQLGLGDGDICLRTLTGLAVCCAATGEQARALSTLDAVMQRAAPEGGLALAEEARIRLMIALFSRDYGTAIEQGERAVALARSAGITYEVALGLNLWGQALLRSGDRARAYACLQQSSTLCEESAEERLGAHSRAFVAYLDAKGNADAANTAIREFIRYAAAHRYLWDESNGRHLLAQLYRDRGELATAEIEFEACGALARSIGYRLITDDCLEALNELRQP
jgi:eukaryotic-like serine/threonine-protein kinase